jgi:hypothetical protein
MLIVKDGFSPWFHFDSSSEALLVLYRELLVLASLVVLRRGYLLKELSVDGSFFLSKLVLPSRPKSKR